MFASVPFFITIYTSLICASDATFTHAPLEKNNKNENNTKKAQQTLIASFKRDTSVVRTKKKNKTLENFRAYANVVINIETSFGARADDSCLFCSVHFCCHIRSSTS